MNGEDWERILKKINYFKIAEAEHNVFSPELLREFKDNIFDALIYNCQHHKHNPDLNIYIAGKKISADTFLEKIYPNGQGTAGCRMQRISQIFQQEQFGIGMNYVEKFSIEIAEKLSDFIQPLIDRIGIPTNGLHTTIHICNYRFPDQDTQLNPTENPAIHLHIGPGNQTIYAWKKSGNPSAQNSAVTTEQQEIQIHHLKPGDIFFMPDNHYFVKQADDFAIGITLWFDSNKNNDLFKKILNGTLADFKTALFSNRGWIELPLTMEEISAFKAEDNFNQLKNRYIQLPYPFKIYHKPLKNEQLAVYARGSKITLKYHHLIPEMIERLNTNEAISTNSLLLELNRKWPESAGLYFLSVLYNKRAVNLLN